MNFNTFFLDKLSSGSQSPTSSSGKTSPSSYLFSDIMKVVEQENGTNLISQPDSVNPISNTIEGLPFSVNVIEYNDIKLKALSDFIKSFIANSQEPTNISELKHDLQPVVISKKQFMLSSGGMEDFIKGLVESININFSDDLKAAVTLNKESSEELKKLRMDIGSDEKEVPLLEKESDDNVAADLPLLNTGTMLESILGFISNNKSLSLSFKSNLEKVNVNLYELPEDNFETKINLEKLASDFIKEGKKIGNTELESSNEIEREEPVDTSFTSVTENKPAGYFISSSEETGLLLEELPPGVVNPETSLKPVGFNAPHTENVYKTEIIEIAYRPNVLLNNLSAAVPSNAEKLSMDPILLSGFTFNDSEVSDVKFRLNDNLSMQLNADASVDKNVLVSTSYVKTEIPNSNSLFKDEVAANNNPDQAVTSKSNEKQEEVNNTKMLLNELNGKLIGVEFKKAVGKDESIKVVKDSASAKSVSSDVSKESKVVIKDAVNKTFAEIEFKKNISNMNFKNILQGTDQIAGTSQIDDKKILFNELNGKLVGVDVKKTEGKDDNVKAVKENESTKSVSGENVKENGTAVKETENKSSDGKDFAQHKSNDSFKNILQSADQINGNDPDKFKIAPELRTSQDVPKIIKTQEIIPEFTKVIHTGEKQSMTFQLTPENLGKVKLIVELVENQINTRIEVENEQVKQFIQSNLEQLKQNLQSSGIQLSTVNVSLTESEQKFSKGFAPRKKSGERVNKVKASDEQTRPTQKSLGYNTYEFLA